MRRYVLEDILQCEVGDKLLFLVSPYHINYDSYQYITSLAPPLPIRNHHGVPFIQIKGVVAKNSRQEELVSDILLPCLLYTSPSPRDLSTSRMPSSA